ncbi:hypothetical protein QO010_003936 [Caulobacter ginsengisoli]|uniref:Two pore domain potassium channel family protein n=1 Tax=Caulobacter ginsengisoli TaxID=400775 RepID=A0ABU0IVU2_9CAUL|nr:hypothetical protein [Caulobacter ginsengisoli]MDQ0466143.1 hypothetical protein [Caulobacter ginsengisoli]
MIRYERKGEPLASRGVFLMRLVGNGVVSLIIIGVSVVGGMAGYHYTEHMSWLDAFANAAMIASGMGPLAPLETVAGKWFAGMYALYSGLVLVGASGLVLAPILHRVMHSLHVADDDDDKPEPRKLH